MSKILDPTGDLEGFNPSENKNLLLVSFERKDPNSCSTEENEVGGGGGRGVLTANCVVEKKRLTTCCSCVPLHSLCGVA